MNYLFREKLAGKYSIANPEANAWWGLCCCEVSTFKYAYFVGRVAPSTFLQTSEIYTGDTDVWSAGSTVPSPGRYFGFGMSNASGTAYCTSGSTTLGVLNAIRDHESYTFSSNIWNSLTDTPTPPRVAIRGGSANPSGGTLFIGYGIDNTSTYLTQVDKFTEGSNTWASSTAGPAPARQNSNLNTVDSFGYSMGGWDGNIANPSLSNLEQLDFSAETWSTKTGMTQARDGGGAFSFGSKLYAVAGEAQVPLSSPVVTNSLEEYDPGSDSWTTRTNVPIATANAPGASDKNGLAGYYVQNAGTGHREYMVDVWTTKAAASSRANAGTGANA